MHFETRIDLKKDDKCKSVKIFAIRHKGGPYKNTA